MSLVRQTTKLLRPAQLLPSCLVLSRDGAAAQSVTCRRGIFGRVTGKSLSKVLSSPSDGLAQIEVVTIKPEYKEDYLKLAAEFIPQVVENANIPVKLVGAWTTLLGSITNTATHLWGYKSFDDVSQSFEKLNTDKSWQEFIQAQGKFVESYRNQIVLPFTFFPSIESNSNEEKKRVFEMRSYELKPGSMIEWGQEWANGIQYRHDEAVGGWFSQIGPMHSVYHLWVYKSLKERNETRQNAWTFPGWDECVRRTVPLIQRMESTILIPTTYSPLQ